MIVCLPSVSTSGSDAGKCETFEPATSTSNRKAAQPVLWPRRPWRDRGAGTPRDRTLLGQSDLAAAEQQSTRPCGRQRVPATAEPHS